MDSLEFVKQKYKDIIPRSFKTKLEIFLFDRCVNNGHIGKFEPWQFMSFKIENDIVKNYEHAWQLGADDSLKEGELKMKEVDRIIEDWLKNNEEFKKELEKEYKVQFITDHFPFSEFEKLYNRNPKERVCHYCKVTDKEIGELRGKGKIHTKRGRGNSMEIDRIKPNWEYTLKNVVLACYWCNNAKTDEFSEGEFQDHIGPGISKVWNEREAKT